MQTTCGINAMTRGELIDKKINFRPIYMEDFIGNSLHAHEKQAQQLTRLLEQKQNFSPDDIGTSDIVMTVQEFSEYRKNCPNDVIVNINEMAAWIKF